MMFRQKRAKPLRPFDEGNALREGFFDPELMCILWLFHPVEIEMPYRRSRKRLVNLDQCEGRAGHLGRSDSRTDKGAGEGGLAATKRPAQPDHIAVSGAASKIDGKRQGGCLIRQLDSHGRGIAHASF